MFLPSIDTVEDAIAYLYSPNEELRGLAARRLAKIGKPAVGTLIEVLQGRDGISRPKWPPSSQELPRRRVNATEASIQALSGIGEPAVEPLIVLLKKDKDEAAQFLAVRVLKAIGRPAVPALMEAVLSVDPKVRHAATSILAEIRDDRAGETLRDLLYREIADYRKQRRRVTIRKAVFISILLVALGVSEYWFHGHGYLFVQLIIQALCIGSFVDATVGIRRNTVTALSNTTDTRMVGAFAACLSDKDKMVRRAAMNALIKLLPQVRADDKKYISAEEMNALIRALDRTDCELTMAILKAFEQIGDEKALPAVERLVDHGKTGGVRWAAQECLPFLRIRAEEARQAHTLLRASMPTVAVAPETLLRPAEGIAPIDANQLLRAQASADS